MSYILDKFQNRQFLFGKTDLGFSSEERPLNCDVEKFSLSRCFAARDLGLSIKLRTKYGNILGWEVSDPNGVTDEDGLRFIEELAKTIIPNSRAGIALSHRHVVV